MMSAVLERWASLGGWRNGRDQWVGEDIWSGGVPMAKKRVVAIRRKEATYFSLERFNGLLWRSSKASYQRTQ